MTLSEFLKFYPARNSRTFGDFVTHKRAEKGISIRKLANDLGITAVYLSQIERNERPAPLNLLEEFQAFLEIEKNEEGMFNDIVYLSRETISPDIIRYLIANPNARKTIKTAIDKNISGDQLYDAVRINTIKEKIDFKNSKSNNELSQFIHKRRLELKKTMDEISSEIGISKTYYFDIEKGFRNFPIEILNKLIIALNVSDDQKQNFIDIAYKSRGVCAPDIIEFVNANPEARNLIRRIINKNISTKQILEIVENQEENLNL